MFADCLVSMVTAQTGLWKECRFSMNRTILNWHFQTHFSWVSGNCETSVLRLTALHSSTHYVEGQSKQGCQLTVRHCWLLCELLGIVHPTACNVSLQMSTWQIETTCCGPADQRQLTVVLFYWLCLRRIMILLSTHCLPLHLSLSFYVELDDESETRE